MIGIIILNWNNSDDTILCIDSVIKSKIDRKIIVLVIDNGSTDDSPSKINSTIESLEIGKPENISLKLIENSENYGFAKGINNGIQILLKQYSVKSILLLNNDVLLDLNSLQYLSSALETQNEYYGLSAALFDDAEYSQIQTYGGNVNLYLGRRENIVQVKPSKIKNGILHVDFIPGACAMYRTEAFLKIGLFDERFFMYTEDVDFGLRIKKYGKKVGTLISARAFHKKSASTGGPNNPFVQEHISRNTFVIAKKHSNAFQISLFLIIGFLVFFVKGFYWLITDRSKFRASIRGIYQGLKSFF